MKCGFRPKQSPATFRDAIFVTRKLGIRYLWKDSLCIIQRDSRDWEIESSRMGGIYRDAYLTIAASSASGDEEGFLKPRPLACSLIRVIFPTGQSTQIYFRSEYYSPYWSEREHSTPPLASRRWCLQENYLSRRQLRFFDDRIVWTCQEYTMDEPTRDDFSQWNGGGNAVSIE